MCACLFIQVTALLSKRLVRGPRGLRGLDRPEKEEDTGTLLLRLPVPMGVVLVVVAVPVGDLLEAMTIVDLFWCWILYVVDDPA